MKKLKDLGLVLTKSELTKIKGKAIEDPIEEKICDEKRKPRIVLC